MPGSDDRSLRAYQRIALFYDRLISRSNSGAIDRSGRHCSADCRDGSSMPASARDGTNEPASEAAANAERSLMSALGGKQTLQPSKTALACRSIWGSVHMRLLFLAAMTGLVLTSMPAAAQTVEPDQRTDVTRYKVYYYKFAPGGKDKAREMFWDHILPAIREAKLPEPIVLHPEDGEWDIVSLYPLVGGYDDLDYNVSPSEAKWQSIAVRRGGAKFQALAQELGRLIVRENSFIAHRHN